MSGISYTIYKASACFQCCGSGMFIPHPIFHSRIPEPNFSIPDPGSASKNLNILHKILFLSYRKYDPDCSTRIRTVQGRFIMASFFTHPKSRIQGTKRHRIPDPVPQQDLLGSRVGTQWSGMICPRISKSRGLMIPLRMFRDTLFRGNSSRHH